MSIVLASYKLLHYQSIDGLYLLLLRVVFVVTLAPKLLVIFPSLLYRSYNSISAVSPITCLYYYPPLYRTLLS